MHISYEIFYILTNTNVATVRNFEVISNKFSVIKICISGSFERKWMTKLYNLVVYSPYQPRHTHSNSLRTPVVTSS